MKLPEELTLRDYLAIHAPVEVGNVMVMAGIRSMPKTDDDRELFWASMAFLRYEYADAMLTAKKAKP